MLDPAPKLSSLLLPIDEVLAQSVQRQSEAAVLVPLYLKDDELTAVFTKRRFDLRHHAGEISFPGGRPDPHEDDLRATALREAEEEIGLAPEQVELMGALPLTSTFVTNFAIYPLVGLVPAGLTFRPNPNEVESVLEFTLKELVAGHERKRLPRKGVPIKTDTYTVDDSLIWGATARIVAELLARLG